MSILLNKLNERVVHLESSLLTFDTSLSTEPENQDKLRAYKLFVHAEIEYYLENVVSEIVNTAKTLWDNEKIINAVLFHIILYSSFNFSGNEDMLEPEKRISNIIKAFEDQISHNNGIKKKDILKLIIPIGIKFDDLDETWLTTIDSYGNKRGKIAHNTFSVQRPLDKRNELEETKHILDGLVDLDAKIKELPQTLLCPFRMQA